ncbi:threonine dehydratase [Rubritalea squalenifaciens DSM 18772]|uniref:threonine ammonia-lyase n=1 Tax=Rubritalea squalenifaciens DSM 18772 TaxID=1123071 RepID=A0A1M6M0I3_9BACT|nr:pyridoxal-phosphate dependent enzyme [Rubritalea squalenifaciens]SHJ76813.1 threonine dehydratase [Rubritalea squalenifaciens DSM 18772]
MDKEQLFQEILMARQRVYAAGKPTPLQKLPIIGYDCEVWAKREDLGPIKAYKWRGAYNAVACLTPEQRAKGIVAASAGNHGQGVARAARKLGCDCIIFMPLSTPEVKQNEVMRHGGDHVQIRLIGDSYDEAGLAAREYCEEVGAVYVHPYNDLATMGGQGTLADEIVMSGEGPFDRVYIAIGGGGLAASVSCWLKRYWPDCKIIGVEGKDQASMKAAIEAGKPVELEYLDVFCDGTAVRKVGENTFKICNELLDEIVTVTNDEVCHAVRRLWETVRAIPEPSGAMGLAAITKDYESGKIKPGEKVLTIVCGANMDFAQLANISRRAGIGSRHRRFLRVPIPEGKGSLVEFLKELPKDVSIVDLQYGRTDSEVQYPVLGLIGTKDDYAAIDALLERRGAKAADVSTEEIVGYRIINYDPDLFTYPLFVNVEFPERAGAFLQFMSHVKGIASLCYFNYEYSGERVGRALVGMEFDSQEDHDKCVTMLKEMVGGDIRDVKPVSEGTLKRLLGE